MDIPALSPNEEVELCVCVRMPETEGKYNGMWRLRGPMGIPFGDKLYVVAFVKKRCAEFKKKVEELVVMGFEYEDVCKALMDQNEDVRLAANCLIELGK